MGGIMKDGNGVSVTVANPLPIGGNTANDAAVSGNPLVIAGRGKSTTPTNVSADNDTVYLMTTLSGTLVNRPYSPPELDWQFAVPSAKIDTTDSVLKAAGAAGVRNYVTAIQMINTNAVATEVVVKDGATVIWRGFLQASMLDTIAIQFPTPLKGTAATAMNFACITTGANVYVNAQGYQAP